MAGFLVVSIKDGHGRPGLQFAFGMETIYMTDAMWTDRCLYIMGAVDALLFAQTTGAIWHASVPQSGVRMEQLTDVMTKFPRDHSELWHCIAVSLVAEAVGRAFPWHPPAGRHP